MNVRPEIKFMTGNYELKSGMKFPSMYAKCHVIYYVLQVLSHHQQYLAVWI